MPWFDFTTGITAVAHPADADDITWTLDEVITSTTLTADHFLIIVNAPYDVTITLPASASHTDRMYTIKNITANKVTIDANSAEEIDGEETLVLGLQYDYVTIVCDGDEWFIIGGQNVKIEDILKDYLGEQLDNQEKMITILDNMETHLALGSGEELEKENE